MSRAGAHVTIRGLSHSYEVSEGSLKVLDDVAVDVRPGGYVALSGPSGAGKSTLLSILGGLESVQTGEVDVAGFALGRLRGGELARYRREVIGFVFQHFGLLDALTAAENVELAFTLSGVPRRSRRKRARELLDSVGLGARFDHRPLQLSGGERQRVAIARAIANEPSLLLADEPTGNLDERNAISVISLLEGLSRDFGMTLLIVTHNSDLAARADARIVIDGGHVTSSGVA